MVKRAWLWPLLAALSLASVAKAKLAPTFRERERAR
jgi:hypothetical protein